MALTLRLGWGWEPDAVGPRLLWQRFAGDLGDLELEGRFHPTGTLSGESPCPFAPCPSILHPLGCEDSDAALCRGLSMGGQSSGTGHLGGHHESALPHSTREGLSPVPVLGQGVMLRGVAAGLRGAGHQPKGLHGLENKIKKREREGDKTMPFPIVLFFGSF